MKIEKRVDLKDIPYHVVYEAFVRPTLEGRRVNITMTWDNLRSKYEVHWYKPYNPCSEINLPPTKQGEESMTEDNAESEFVEVEITTKVSLPSFEGYRYTGEYRRPEVGEYALSAQGEVEGPIPAIVLSRRVSCTQYILEKIRWRASHGGHYFYTTDCGQVSIASDRYLHISNLRYRAGNYYRCEQEAENVAVKIRELFKIWAE